MCTFNSARRTNFECFQIQQSEKNNLLNYVLRSCVAACRAAPKNRSRTKNAENRLFNSPKSNGESREIKTCHGHPDWFQTSSTLPAATELGERFKIIIQQQINKENKGEKKNCCIVVSAA